MDGWTWEFGKSGVWQLINHEGVCRTAPATPGLLIIVITSEGWQAANPLIPFLVKL